MPKTAHNCPLETMLEQFLTDSGIAFSRPERIPGGKTVDFCLPEFGDLYIEVKTFATERLLTQLERNNLTGGPVMVLIGLDAVRAFCALVELWRRGRG